MADILHWIRTGAPPDRVFEGVTTEEGLASWWTDDVEAEAEEGSVAVFGFNDRAVVFRMRVDERAPELVRWTRLADFPEWESTRLEFRIEGSDDGGSELFFIHAGWDSTEGAFHQCNTDWGRLMYSLKDHLEGRGGVPMKA